MTKKKSDNTLLIAGGGLLAVLAVGAYLMTRPSPYLGDESADLPGSVWQPDLSGNFSANNSVLRYYGGGLLGQLDRLFNGTPAVPVLAPVKSGDTFGTYIPNPLDKYLNLGGTSPATGTDESSGWTSAGSSSSGGSFSTKYPLPVYGGAP